MPIREVLTSLIHTSNYRNPSDCDIGQWFSFLVNNSHADWYPLFWRPLEYFGSLRSWDTKSGETKCIKWHIEEQIQSQDAIVAIDTTHTGSNNTVISEFPGGW